jgi:hypothetical protein
MAKQRPCNCGSGLPKRALHDAAGIFLTYVCDDCVTTKRVRYKPAIFDQKGRYAQTGEEEDIPQ